MNHIIVINAMCFCFSIIFDNLHVLSYHYNMHDCTFLCKSETLRRVLSEDSLFTFIFIWI